MYDMEKCLESIQIYCRDLTCGGDGLQRNPQGWRYWLHVPRWADDWLVASVPGSLHGVLSQVDVPVDQVEEAKGHWEKNAGILVDGASAGQLRYLGESWALL